MLLASQVDPALPAQPLVDWLSRRLGPQFRISWTSGHCGCVTDPAAPARVCLTALWDSGPGSVFGHWAEVLLTPAPAGTPPVLRVWRIRESHDLMSGDWRELPRLRDLPVAVELGRGHWQAVNEAGDRANEEMQADRREGWRFHWRCWTRGHGLAPIHEAALRGDVGRLRALLQSGADVDERWYACHGNWHEAPARGGTAIQAAAGEGHVEAVRLLLQHNADPFARDNKIGDAWDHALHHDQQAVLQLLSETLGTRIGARRRERALYRTVKPYGDLHELRYWLQQLPDIEPLRLEPALIAAAQYGQLAMARELLAHDAAVTANVLVTAARGRRSIPVLEWLLDHGANPNARYQNRYTTNDDDVTPLIAVARHAEDAPTAARLLLQHGADVNAADGQGQTALAYAERRQQAELAALLRAAGGRSESRTAGAAAADCPLKPLRRPPG